MQYSICDVRLFLLFSRRPKMFHVCTVHGESSCGIVLPGYNGFIWNCISIETHEIYAYQHCPCCSKMVWTCVPKFLNYCQKTLKSAVWGLREPAFLAVGARASVSATVIISSSKRTSYCHFRRDDNSICPTARASASTQKETGIRGIRSLS